MVEGILFITALFAWLVTTAVFVIVTFQRRGRVTVKWWLVLTALFAGLLGIMELYDLTRTIIPTTRP